MYQIISDGSCDLGKEVALELNLCVVPFYVSTDGKEYKKEVEELAVRELYQFMIDNPKVFPKTSLPSVQDYIGAFESFVEHQISVICICINSKFSGSYNSANNAKQILLETYTDAKITIIDSTILTVLQGIYVREACRMKSAGLEYQEVIDKMEEIKATGRIFFTIDTMEYLINGGRAGKLAGIAVGTLGIRPVINFENGELKLSGLSRGRKKSREKLIEQLLNYIKESGDLIDQFTFAVGYGYDDKEVREFKREVLEAVQLRYPNYEIEIELFSLGAVIGVYTGPNPLGVGLIKKYID